MIMWSIHNRTAIDAYARQSRIDPYNLRRLRNAFYKQALRSNEALQVLPAEKRPAFAKAIAFHCLSPGKTRESARDGTVKLAFKTHEGWPVETVILRIASGRTSLCLSSQAGCAGKCVFCATGQMPRVHNLTADQILDQVLWANQRLQGQGIRARNLAFMGMGEPFHNEQALYVALRILCDTACFNYAPRRIMISTVGLPEAMIRFARRFPEVHLAVSLHSAIPEVREKLVPLARHPDPDRGLPNLREAIREVSVIQDQPVMIEVLMLKGLTDTTENLAALQAYLRGLSVRINLIPLNPVPGLSGIKGSDPARCRAFAQALRAAGFQVTLRYSLGADITAACGQLARQDRRSPRRRGAAAVLVRAP